MTGPRSGVAIPARLTANELAELIDVLPMEVQAVLEAKGEPSALSDIVGPEMSIEVSRALGRLVTIEPRDLALEILYESESRGETEIPRVAGRAAILVNGVLAARERLDREIEEASEHWSVARMPVVDRTILRIGLYELESQPEIPTAVVVSEAVRLAKTYSTERSGAFVNGVLATLADRVRNV